MRDFNFETSSSSAISMKYIKKDRLIRTPDKKHLQFMDIKKNQLWAKKSLICDFAIADLKVRYRNSVLGFVWTFLEPLLLLAVLYVVFTNIFRSQIEYFPLYLLLGLITWNMFVRGTQLGLNSTLSRSGILSQIYIPKEIPPISSSLTSLIMLAFEMIVFGVFMAIFGFVPSWTIIILPAILILEFILITGIALPLSLLNIKFRDTQFVWGIILQAGFFVTPIFYKIDILPQQIRGIIIYNPMVQILNMAHDAVLYGTLPSKENIAIVVGMTSIVFIVGYVIFRKLSPRIIEEL